MAADAQKTASALVASLEQSKSGGGAASALSTKPAAAAKPDDDAPMDLGAGVFEATAASVLSAMRSGDTKSFAKHLRAAIQACRYDKDED